MPLYGSFKPQNLMKGIPFLFFNAETLTAPAKSIPCVHAGEGMGLYAPILFVVNFSAVPTSDTLLVQGSLNDIDAQYQTLFTSTTKQNDFYQDSGLFTFYRINISALSGGGTATVSAIRK